MTDQYSFISKSTDSHGSGITEQLRPLRYYLWTLIRAGSEPESARFGSQGMFDQTKGTGLTSSAKRGREEKTEK